MNATQQDRLEARILSILSKRTDNCISRSSLQRALTSDYGWRFSRDFMLEDWCEERGFTVKEGGLPEWMKDRPRYTDSKKRGVWISV